MNLRTSFNNFHYFGVAPVAFHRVVLAEAAGAMNLDGVGGGLNGRCRGKVFGYVGGQQRFRAALLVQIAGPVTKQPGRGCSLFERDSYEFIIPRR